MEGRPLIDVAWARAQHDAYRRMLEGAGYEVSVIPADEDCPDCPFIEDAAVLLNTLAVIGDHPTGGPGASSRDRSGEGGTLAGHAACGADRAGHARWRGCPSPRRHTLRRPVEENQRCRHILSQLAEIAAGDGLRVIAAPVSNLLHLKSAVLGLDDETVLIAPDCTDPTVFVGHRLIEKPPGERGASALRLADGSVVVTANTPVTMGLVSGAGFEVDWFDVSEFQKADGGLTCLSLLR
jgi:dimethylargininase